MAHSISDMDVRSPASGSEPDSADVVIPTRPLPTPGQAKLGIVSAANGNGTFGDIMDAARPRPVLDDAEFEAFERAIAENRVMQRQIAREKDS